MARFQNPVSHEGEFVVSSRHSPDFPFSTRLHSEINLIRSIIS